MNFGSGVPSDFLIVSLQPIDIFIPSIRSVSSDAAENGPFV